MKFVLFLLTFNLIAPIASIAGEGASYRRMVEFEWDPIEGAVVYDIELKVIKAEGEDKMFAFKTTESKWKGQLRPGKYLMRLRSKDHRKVPGDWSEYSDFIVGLDPVVWKSPKDNDNIKTKEKNSKKVTLAWQATPGAKDYALSVYNEKDEQVTQEVVSGTSKTLDLPVTLTYKALVRARAATGVESEKDSQTVFTLIGDQLDKPEIERPENDFVRSLQWEKPELSENYKLKVLKFDPKTRKFKAFKEYDNYADQKLDFPQDWPGGNYRLLVQAQAKNRLSSKVAGLQFKVFNGDRSPASEYKLTMKQSIDRITGWYGIASYLLTQIQYTNANGDFGTATSYNSLGGTGRLGIGYFGYKSNWGFLSSADMSGFLLNGKAQTFSSLELSSVYRLRNLDRSEIRFTAGPYYKEIPETIGLDQSSSTSPDANNYESQKISVLGAQLGAEYWYSFSPRFGLQLHTKLYYSLAKVSTPNNMPILPGLSNQVGILGSYKLSEKWTGLFGYAYRKDEIRYQKLEDSVFDNIPENLSSVTGHYLNLYCEYEF